MRCKIRKCSCHVTIAEITEIFKPDLLLFYCLFILLELFILSCVYIYIYIYMYIYIYSITECMPYIRTHIHVNVVNI